MIKTFRDAETKALFEDRPVRKWRAIERQARRKLVMLHAAPSLNSLQVPPESRQEALKGDRQDQHSIRINDQWRVRFMWKDGDAYDVEIVDYH